MLFLGLSALAMAFLPSCGGDPEPREDKPARTEKPPPKEKPVEGSPTKAGRGEKAFAKAYEGAARELDGDREGALAAYEKAYRSAPNSDVLCRRLALAYHKAGHTDKALACLRDHIGKAKDGAPSVRLALAGLLDKLGKTVEAQAQLGAIDALPAVGEDVLLELFTWYDEKGRPQEAARALVRAAKSSENGSRLYRQAGAYLERNGYLREAEDLYRRGMETAADTAEHLRGIVRCLTSLGDLRGALTAVKELAASLPRDPAALLRAAEIESRIGRLDKAQELLDGAAARFPRSADIRLSLGDLLQRRGLAEKARTAFEEAARLAPEKAEIQYRLGVVLEELGLVAEAKAALEKALDLEPADPKVRAYLAFLRTVLGGSDDDTLAWAEEAAAREPELGAWQATVALLQSRRGDAGKAEALFDKALHETPDPTVYWLYALYLREAGRAKEGRAYLEKAARMEARFKKILATWSD